MPDNGKGRKGVFEAIYRGHEWGGGSRSGPGSDPENTTAYIGFLQRWLASHSECRHLVEVGCGDWATSRLMQLAPDQDYIGYDIVPDVIARNAAAYQSEKIRFICADFLEVLPAEGDLLIAKDVLQHLSNASVARFIDRLLPRYRFAIIVNDVRKIERRKVFGLTFGQRDIQVPNSDISDGGSRPLRLDVPPFSLLCQERFTYEVILRQKPTQVVYLKEVVVWAR